MPILACPICGRTLVVARRSDARFRPFCSHRCKMVDLGRWLDGTYTITEPATPEDIPPVRAEEENCGVNGRPE